MLHLFTFLHLQILVKIHTNLILNNHIDYYIMYIINILIFLTAS